MTTLEVRRMRYTEVFCWKLTDTADNIIVHTVHAFTMNMAEATGVVY